jgi:hypothetical protein
MILKKDPIYPIKMFSAFEAIDENQQYDPISGFMELLGKTKQGEIFGIQYIISPIDGDWFKPWISKLDELKEAKKKVAPSAKLKFDFSGGPMPLMEVSKGEVKEDATKFITRSPGETDTLKTIEDNISKPAFETVIRIFYMGPKQDFYSKYARSGVVGIFNQYAGMNTNSFTRNFRVSTEAKFDIKPYVFPTQRANYRKNRMLLNYVSRNTHPGSTYGKIMTSYAYNFNTGGREIILNTEALATLFHPPTSVVLTAPHIQRMASRKAGPPAGVAIFGHERDIEKYQ